MTDDDRLRLLVIEDESHIAAGLKLNLELEGYSVQVATTAREAGGLVLEQASFSLILLDVMLPDINGFEFCKRLRDSGNFTPVLMLTALNSPGERVKGLEAGADDYLAKPFALEELLARVKSLLRRRQWDQVPAGDQHASRYLEFGEARIDFDRFEAESAGKPVSLTRLECDLLKYFAENPGRVLSRRELMEDVWHMGNYPNTRTVDNFVLRLRKYFEPDPARPVHFISVRGLGYKFEPGIENDQE